MSAWMTGKTLAALTCVWIGVLAYQFMGRQAEPETPLRYVSGNTSPAGSNAAPMPEDNPVRMPNLKSLPASSTLTKNIFAPLDPLYRPVVADPERQRPWGRSVQQAHPSHPPQAVPAVVAVSPEETAAQQALARATADKAQALQQMSQFRFVGYLSEDGRARAFLGRGADLFILTSGEMLDGKFVVTALDASAVKLREPHTDTELTIGLTMAQ